MKTTLLIAITLLLLGACTKTEKNTDCMKCIIYCMEATDTSYTIIGDKQLKDTSFCHVDKEQTKTYYWQRNMANDTVKGILILRGNYKFWYNKYHINKRIECSNY